MKISIITATYNSEKNIKDCLQSVAQQTSPIIEHIIIDGSSRDKTIEIVKSTPSVDKYISEKDTGIYDALNKGLKLATGDIIGFVHSDDMLANKNIIKNIKNIFKHNSDVYGVFGDLLFVDAENTSKTVRFWKSKPFNYKNIKNGWVPPHPSLFLRKEVYLKHGSFDISFTCAGDYDFMLRIMKDKNTKLVYLPEVITKMRTGGISTGNFKQLVTKSNEDIRALRKNGFRFPLIVVLLKILRKVPQLFQKKNLLYQKNID